MIIQLQNGQATVSPFDIEDVKSRMVTEDGAEQAVLDQGSRSESEQLASVHRKLCRPLADTGDRSSQWQLRQLSAKLHCLYGVSIDTVHKDTSKSLRYSLRSDTVPVHPYARSLVYDLRQHSDPTLWGPFLDDGLQTVDWEKIEAIMIILDHNMKHSAEMHHVADGASYVQDKPFVGASPKSYVSRPPSIPMKPPSSLEAQDPYNITGVWMRVVCFLDYSELYDFNFDGEEIPDEQPRRPIDTDEAIRLITMKLQVTKIEAPGEEDGQQLPVVHFKGDATSQRLSFDPNANSRCKGNCKFYTLCSGTDNVDN